MEQLVLPRQPFTREEAYIRNSVSKKAIYGINNEGLGFAYIEHDDLDPEFGLTVREIPVMMDISSDDYGVFRSIRTFWKKVLVSPTGKIVKNDYPVQEQKTNVPDMIIFSAVFGVPMLPSIIGGKIRGIDGFDDQPLFANNTRVPDSNYDTTLPPSGGYADRKPQTIIVDETQV